MFDPTNKKTIALVAFWFLVEATSSSGQELGTAEIVEKRYARPWLANFFDVVGHANNLEIFLDDYYPEDFIQDYEQHKSTKFRPLVIWTGIVVHKRAKERPDINVPSEELLIEHRYWDWKTTLDDHLVLISNRGRGKYLCTTGPHENVGTFEIGDFVITYGIPISILEEIDVINVECMHTIKLVKGLFTTQAWEYGRDFVDHGDFNDLRILRYDIE